MEWQTVINVTGGTGGGGGALASSTDTITWGDRKSGNAQTLVTSIDLGDGAHIFAGAAGFLGNSSNLAINQYSTAYNASTEFYVPAVTPTSFGTLQANVSYLVGITQTIYIKAAQ